jgi:hypothetical protein
VSHTDRWRAVLWHLSVILCLDQVYEVGRGLIPQHPDRALRNAARIIHWEQSHHIFREPSIQHFWLGHGLSLGWLQIQQSEVVRFVNMYYLYAHFLGTAAFLIWLYFCRRSAFRFVRDVIFTSTGLALIIYIIYPTAPPRLVHHYGFVDTLTMWLNTHQSVVGAYNPYAAMPSLHFVWAFIVGATLATVGRSLLLRVIGPLYTLLMLATIVISANHYILDAVGSVVVVLVATAGVWLADGLASGRLSPPAFLDHRLRSAL